MADTLPIRSGLQFRPGAEYPSDPYYDQQEREQEYQQQLYRQQVVSRLERFGMKSNDQADAISQAMKAGKSLRDLRRLLTSATIVALILVFMEMHIRFAVCNLFGGSIPMIAEDKLNGLEIGIMLFVDWLIVAFISIALIILLPIIDPKLFVDILLRQWWDSIVGVLGSQQALIPGKI